MCEIANHSRVYDSHGLRNWESRWGFQLRVFLIRLTVRVTRVEGFSSLMWWVSRVRRCRDNCFLRKKMKMGFCVPRIVPSFAGWIFMGFNFQEMGFVGWMNIG
jgi:hypothetical protein